MVGYSKQLHTNLSLDLNTIITNVETKMQVSPFIGLELNGPVNTVKVISSPSVKLLTLFLDKFSPVSV